MADLAEFQKQEYQYIAEAHFKTIDAISSFFRYYLLIMSLPLTAAAGFFLSSTKSSDQVRFPPFAWNISGLILMLFALVGVCVLAYVTNLRFDVILYARAVNAIRKYFYDDGSEPLLRKIRTRVLPQTTFSPSYFEPTYFLSVVLVFALFNSFYFALGYFVLAEDLTNYASLSSLAIFRLRYATAFLLGTLLHILFYVRLASQRENRYLQRHGIGIDLDGVINRHREHFCVRYNHLVKPTFPLHPEQITVIPVHENMELNVSIENEQKVFNDPAYWIDMPPDVDAVKYVRRIHAELGVPIFYFTSRGWPKVSGVTEEFETQLEQQWEIAIEEGFSKKALERPTSEKGRTQIERITYAWIEKHGFAFGKVHVEPGRGGKKVNRFEMAKEKALQFFVEDDWNKAAKLAYICDVVFLINHPYNSPQPLYLGRGELGRMGRLPDNVIRVESWLEVYRFIRAMV